MYSIMQVIPSVMKMSCKLTNALAESTLKSMNMTNGVVITPNLVSNRFIHFTFDNIDINDSSLDGKNNRSAAWSSIKYGITKYETSKREYYTCSYYHGRTDCCRNHRKYDRTKSNLRHKKRMVCCIRIL